MTNSLATNTVMILGNLSFDVTYIILFLRSEGIRQDRQEKKSCLSIFGIVIKPVFVQFVFEMF